MTFFSLRDVGKKRVVLRLMNGIPAYVWYFVSKFPCESVCFAEKRFMLPENQPNPVVLSLRCD
ncbi:hypothetical protein BWP33_05375 [Simonsiella muelleri ATCC 29453]|uniref:Uncharacterized protein n=1 Tax=Simonsiella muelleri ATCC 29453 TaxID=641147 RepID=U6Q1K3_9NEIS|nr:hypothetical protein BWP33_05375 [Simonsiella muelleri ATCC 29453]EJZ50213.1 hypothetical protein HMPREF9021_02547 [Simonsiella muelleri ATCC 29453]